MIIASRRSRFARMWGPGRKILLGALTIALLLGLAVGPATAEIIDGTYSASVSPDSCIASSTNQAKCFLTFTITNGATPVLLQKATINAPDADFDIRDAVIVDTPAGLNGDKQWSAAAEGNRARLSANTLADGLLPTESVSATLTIHVPLSKVGPGPYVFATSASGVPILETDLIGQFVNSGNDPSVSVVDDQENCFQDADSNSDCSVGPVDKTENGVRTIASAEGSDGVGTQSLTLSVGGAWADQVQGECRNSFTALGLVVTTNMSGDGNRSHVVTVILPKGVSNSPGLAHYDICVKSDGAFLQKNGELDNEGVLPNCDPLLGTITKCVISRQRHAGDTIIKYFVNPGDPFGIPGLDG